ncbi:hypothetical protein FC83_GL000665 [Agrilactobacillus composti DSM 18527 = JCM 14202]|uniref:Uncharacterized protein n=2 Tax=Agrilactobacillus TaxID=2767875 RepID=X0PP26_9LACO|nr:hypothetical protein FC83_GL000665 [Agrilactobacillus composti DSM 18527 = JCM 14202]GAF39367.1 hypothetical protein JCM14202_1226 [Agrilactobacillus composti DSM 18527 = JCM 14202]
MDTFIAAPALADNVRTPLLKAKQALTDGKYDQQVATQLASQLSRLGTKQELSAEMLDFLVELERQYPGFGRRDTISF